MSRLKDVPELRRDGSNLTEVMQAVRETLQTFRGYRGDKLDQALTLRDLSLATQRGILGGGGLNTGVDGGSHPVTPPGGITPIDLTPPPTPTGLAVSAAITSLFVQCDQPVYTQGHGHDVTVVYGAQWPSTDPTAPTFSSAVELFRFQGPFSAYPTNPATRWCIWIKWKSVDGVQSTSPAGGTNGVQATTGQDVATLLTALNGQIKATQLYADLGSRIDLIDGPPTLIGSVAKRIYDETTARNAAFAQEATDRAAAILVETSNRNLAIDTINATLEDISGTPVYDSGVTYVVDQIVKYSGGLYKATATTTGNLPTNTSFWAKIGDYASLGDAVAGHSLILNDHETRITNTAGAVTAVASRTTAIETAVNSPTTGLSTKSSVAYVDTAKADAISTAASATQLVQSHLDTTNANVTTAQGTANTAVSNAATAQSTANTAVTAAAAVATRASALEATVNSGTTGIGTKSSVAYVDTAKADAISTAASATQLVQSHLDTTNANVTTAQGTANTAVSNAATAQSTANTAVTAAAAVATRASALEATVNSGTTGIGTKASVTYVDTAKSDAISAAATASQLLVSAIKVGGRNIVKGSNFDAAFPVYTNAPADLVSSVVSPTGGVDNAPFQTVTYTSHAGQMGIRGNPVVPFKPNTQYVLSVYVQTTDRGDQYAGGLGLRWNVQPTSVTPVDNPTVSINWTRHSFLVNWGATVDANFFITIVEGVGGGNIQFSKLKIEEGTIPTAWTPAPEDVDAAIAVATAAISTEASTRATADQTEADARTTLASTLRTEMADGDAASVTAATAYVDTNFYTKTNRDAAEAAQNSTLRSEFASADATTLSTAQNYTYSKATIDGALTTQTNTITAAYQSADTATYNSAKAYVEGYSYSISNADAAISGQVNTVKSTLEKRTNGQALNTDPYFRVPSDWEWGHHGNMVDFVTIGDGVAGPYTAQAGTAGGSIDARVVATTTAGRRYRVSAELRRSEDSTGTAYLRHVRKDDNNNTLTQVIDGFERQLVTTAWVRYYADFIATSADVFIAPRAIMNWPPGTPGWMQAQDLRIEDVTDVVAVESLVTSESSTRSTADTALGGRIDTVSARLNSGGDTYQAIVTSQSTATAAANGVGSLATQVTTLQSTVSGNTSSIQTNAQTQATDSAHLYAQYTVKLDVGGKVSGYGIASDGPTGAGSAFAIRADRFYVAAPSGVSGVGDTFPFIVQATATTINGVAVPAGMYANDAYIMNGTITNAKIANLAVDDAKIANLAISTAKIADAAITTAKIGDAQITGDLILDGTIPNAKIGNAAINYLKLSTGAASSMVGLRQFGTLPIPINSSFGEMNLGLINVNATALHFSSIRATVSNVWPATATCAVLYFYSEFNDGYGWGTQNTLHTQVVIPAGESTGFSNTMVCVAVYAGSSYMFRMKFSYAAFRNAAGGVVGTPTINNADSAHGVFTVYR